MLSPLATEALACREYAPYFGHSSKHCALDTNVGVIAAGAVQICSYPNSVCAVRAAVVTAIARGATEIRGVAVDVPTGAEGDTYSLCNCCIQFLSIFANGDCPIELINTQKDNKPAVLKKTNLADLRVWPVVPQSSFLTGSWIKRDWLKELKIAPLSKELPATYTPLQSVDSITPDQLCELAVEACQKCYVPISSFPVGAAALFSTKSDQIMIATAANIERDDGLHLGLCAEQSCLCAATSMGGIKEIKMLAVCCLKSTGIGRPCGMCRQSLVEFGDYPVLMCVVDPENRRITHQKTMTMELLPEAFTPASLV